jgi:hypothetical protein
MGQVSGIMDFNSPLFDKIRVKPRGRAAAPKKPVETKVPCAHPGCTAPGVYKAPKGRDHEGEFFSFCMEHVREYNAHYDYFKGMDDQSMEKYREAEVTGHRPTWKMGARAAGQPASSIDETVFAEARTLRRRGLHRTRGNQEQAPRYNALALKALFTLELDANATEASIKAKYKELVKRLHPDANGGDRSSEEKLREIIQAYNYLKANKLV